VYTGGTTNYQAAFADLLVRIPQDVHLLKGQGYEVFRPVVFFLTDGRPDTGLDWRGAHAKLTDRAATHCAPNIIACGVGAAEASTIMMVATRSEFAFVTARGADIGDAITAFFIKLTSTVIVSGQSLDSGNPTLAFDPPPQFVLAMDVM
jgi:uncharacterized protein YegL